MRRIQIFMLNGLLLTGTALLMRTIGVAFNAYITKQIGAAGIGLFSLIMSVYTFAVTFAAAGINLASTRLTAEAIGRGSQPEVRAAMKRCIVYSLIMGCAACLILFFGSEFIGTRWLGDEKTVPSLRILSVSLPFIALSSAMNGYFTAVRRVVKTAAAQLFEQFIRIGLTIYGLTMLAPKGLKYQCIAIVGGTCISELISCFVVIMLYFRDLRRHNGKKDKKPYTRHMTKDLLNITVPVALSSYVRSGLVTLEHILIPYGLRKNGATYETSLASYGVLHGMVFPVIFFPAALINSYSGLLVPELAEAKERGETKQIEYIVVRMFRIAMMFGVGAAGIMLCFSYELGIAIYNNAEASQYIRIMAPLMPVMFLDTTVDSMLKGLGEQLYSMRVNIIDASLSVILVWFLVPVLGVKGYIIEVFFCEIINAALSIARLVRVCKFTVRPIPWLGVPLIAICGSTCAVRALFYITAVDFGSYSADLTVGIILSVVFYLILLFMLRCINTEDISLIRRVLSGEKKSVKA